MADLWKKIRTEWNRATWAIPVAVCFVIFAFAVTIIGGIMLVVIIIVAPFILLCSFVGLVLLALFLALVIVDGTAGDFRELRTKEEYPSFYRYVKSLFFSTKR